MGLDDLSKEELKDLVRGYAKNIIAMDGIWFQSNEKKNGMDEAMEHDRNVWKNFSISEGRRLKKFLHLEEHPGLTGLKEALSIRFSALGNPVVELYEEGDFLIYKVVKCRVQIARKRKGMPYHPCKSAAIFEQRCFASAIDDRIKCDVISCYPDVTDENAACVWRFYIPE